MEEPEPQLPAAKMNKEIVKRFRVTSDEVRSIETKAASAGLSFSEYCRRATLGKTIVERIPPELRQLLGTASSNLTQLARLASVSKLPGANIDALNDLVIRLRQTLR